MRTKKPKLPDPFSVTNKLFFKVPLAFQMHQSGLSQSEKDVYIFFMIQVKYKKKLEIEASHEEIMYWTGLKSIATITSAIKGLAKKGWLRDVIYRMQKSSIYVLNLEPSINPELIEKLNSRSENTRQAKKKSIANGETGKFIKKENENATV